MRSLYYIAIFFLLLLLNACGKSVESNNVWFRDRNVCKKMVNKVLVYTVFVKDKKGEDWSYPDRKEFGDSLQVALSWMEKQAGLYDAQVNYISELHPDVVVKGYPKKTVAETKELISSEKGINKFNKHYDCIAKAVAIKVEKKEELEPLVGAVKSKERLIAKLRNIYQVESVVLIYAHKPEGLNHFYLTTNMLSNEDVEYIVTTFRSPTVLGYQICQLFGAAPLMYNKSKKKELKSWEYVQDHFPNDIMANLGKPIHGLDIGVYNAYLLGWLYQSSPAFNQLVPLREVYKE